jgi:hypothetical protein
MDATAKWSCAVERLTPLASSVTEDDRFTFRTYSSRGTGEGGREGRVVVATPDYTNQEAFTSKTKHGLLVGPIDGKPVLPTAK